MKKIFFVLLIFGIFISWKNFVSFDKNYFNKKNEQHLLISSQAFDWLIKNYKKDYKIFPFQDFLADLGAINLVQYVGKNISKEYFEDLDKLVFNVIFWKPEWENIYLFASNVIPISKYSLNPNKYKTWEDAVKIGEFGLFFVCSGFDENRFLLQKKLYGEAFCKNYKLPASVGFDYFYYLGQKLTAKKYYKLAKNAPNSPDYIKTFYSVLDNDKKSYLYFYYNSIILRKKYQKYGLQKLKKESINSFMLYQYLWFNNFLDLLKW